MLMTEESARVRKIVTDSLAELLVNCLKFKAQFTVEALFAITLDSEHEFHFTVSENVKIDLPNHAECAASPEQQKTCTQEKNEVALIGSRSEPMSVDHEVCIVEEDLKKSKVNNHDNDKTQTETDLQNHAGSDASSDIHSANCMIKEPSEPLVEESTLIASEPMSVDDEVCIVQEDLKKSRVNNDEHDETRRLSPKVKEKQASDDVRTASVINIVPESSEWNVADDHDSYSLPLEMTAEEGPSNDVEDKPAFIEDQPPTEEKPVCVEIVNDGTSPVESTPAPSNKQHVVYVDIYHSETNQSSDKSSDKIMENLRSSTDPKLRQALDHTSPKIYLRTVKPPVKRSDKHTCRVENPVNHSSAKHDTHVEQKSWNATVPARCKVIKLVQVDGTAGKKIVQIFEESPAHVHEMNEEVKPGASSSIKSSQASATHPSPSPSVNVQGPRKSFQIVNVGRKTKDKALAQMILLSKGPMVSATRIRNLFQHLKPPAPQHAEIKCMMKKLAAEQFGRAIYEPIYTPTGNSGGFVFHKKHPAELKFPITKYEVSKEEYVQNFYDAYSQGWDPDKHKGLKG